ncbi:MAG: PDDEXK nuclease domain-containing protein [Oscillospiraceae bacterium]|nr:PDDEXK nuclease domain-containing protein [Oscillospiraceae bacterium]
MNNELEIIKSNTHERVRDTILIAKNNAYTVINSTMVGAYWEIGKEISESIGDRAEYGKGLIKYLSEQLTAEFGKGFDESTLRKMRKFYTLFPIRDSLSPELSWTHYRVLIRIENAEKRNYYAEESTACNWTVRQLERQINSFYYERLLATQESGKESVKNEIYTTEPQADPSYLLKDPYILEFLDLKENRDYHELELEQELIDKLQDFLLELGKGFSFVARQKRITTDHGEHYYIDLVFYNFILKCFVVIDLKTSKLTYQDVGQIDFYVRLFDDKVKQADDNPTIGIILCSEKDETIAKYSVLADKETLFATKYMSFLPTEDELKREIERERELIERRILLEAPE